MMQNFMLSTSDNPFNPFTQWEEWFAWDVAAGYNTCAYLARVVATADGLSEADRLADVDDAIEEIIKENVLGIYVKVYEDS